MKQLNKMSWKKITDGALRYSSRLDAIVYPGKFKVEDPCPVCRQHELRVPFGFWHPLEHGEVAGTAICESCRKTQPMANYTLQTFFDPRKMIWIDQRRWFQNIKWQRLDEAAE